MKTKLDERNLNTREMMEREKKRKGQWTGEAERKASKQERQMWFSGSGVCDLDTLQMWESLMTSVRV